MPCSLVGALVRALEPTGPRLDFGAAMGHSAVAFATYFARPQTYAADPACRGEDALHQRKLVEACGYGQQTVWLSNEAAFRQVAPVVVESLRKGVPVVALGLDGDDEWGLIVGAEHGGATLLANTYAAGEGRPVRNAARALIFLIRGTGNSRERWDLIFDALCTAAKLAKEEPVGGRHLPAHESGLGAYEAWIEYLRDHFKRQQSPSLPDHLGNARSFDALIHRRRAAASYLIEYAGVLGPESRVYIERAAMTYEALTRLLTGARLQCAPYPTEGAWLLEMHLVQADILQTALTHEREALAHIGSAIEHAQ